MKRVIGWIASSIAAIGILAVGIVGFAVMYLTAPQADVLDNVDKRPVVRAFRIERRSHRVTIKAHGTSKAGQRWNPAAEVAGRVVQRFDNFEAGELIREGTVIAKLDDAEHLSAIEQLEAEIDIEGLNVQLTNRNLETLKIRYQNLQRQVEITAERYGIVKDLVAQGAESERTAELLEEQWIRESNELSQLGDQDVKFQTDLARSESTIKKLNAQLDDARNRFAKTSIVMPFDGICASRDIDLNRYLTVGQPIGTFVSISRTDVEVFLEVDAHILYDADDLAEFRFNILDEAALANRELIELPAIVRLLSHPDTTYQGMARRARFTDPGSRTIPVTIEVESPYNDVGIDHPALSPNLFCEVTILGRTIANAFVIPREAVFGNHVQVIRDGKLVFVDATDGLIQQDLVVIEEGIEPGDLVVLSEVYPATEGMELQVEIVDDPTTDDSVDGTGS